MAAQQQVDMNRMINVIVYTEEGQALSMKSLWQYKPAIFIFLRHFSCIACRAHVAQIWQHRFTLEQEGAKIYFIGNGSFREILKFKKDMGIDNATVLTDPSRRSYLAAGLRRGVLPAIGPQAAVNAVDLFRQGHRQKHYHREAGDLWQLGGVMVVNPGGLVKYHYVSTATGDFPSAVEISNGPATADTPFPVHPTVGDYSMR